MGWNKGKKSMRICLSIGFKNQELSIYYRYHIQGLIFGYLRTSHREFGDLLHNIGFEYNDRVRFKFFCFSGLVFERPLKLPKGREHFFVKDLTANLYISSCLDEFVKHLIQGLFKRGETMRIGKANGTITEVSTLEEIEVKSEMVLKPLFSPVVMKVFERNKKGRHFLEGDDEELGPKLEENLIKKYQLFYGKDPLDDHLEFEFPTHRTSRVPIQKRLRDGGWYRGESIGNVGTFKVKGPEELIRMGLDVGFGSQNSMGCGYCEVVG